MKIQGVRGRTESLRLSSQGGIFPISLNFLFLDCLDAHPNYMYSKGSVKEIDRAVLARRVLEHVV